MAMQSILHVLFLPTPFKRALAQASAAVNPPSSEPSEKPEPSANVSGKRTRVEDMFTEVLKPGALYRECSVAAISVAPLPEPPKQAQDAEKKAKADKKAGDEKKDKKVEEDLVIEDDGEYGGGGNWAGCVGMV
ncbi:hypothetical protein EW026_g6879 [Hermanssonia centrifuga]|uniref:Uncharacterized protein n=1 Tax=Hermanssonia centrifuga TaxID=98765 RepID=A0A4S4K9L6_9APHY|nr:hypothetical protein EW026_g6879 [Hermanssonia centrifuga]